MGLLAFTLLAGCQHMPDWATSQGAQSSAGDIDNDRSLPTEIASFLTEATSGERGEFSQTPWGSPATLTAQPTYYAASGRQCRPVDVATPAGGALTGLACRHDDENWHWVRNVTR